MKHKTHSFFFLFLLFIFIAPVNSFSGVSIENGLMNGMPIPIGSSEVDLDVCPEGARTIGMFLMAWQKGDYKAMYVLLDDESKRNYSFEQAIFDFQLLELKKYKISSIRKIGNDFEFILSYGNWRDGDKDLKKMIIDGKTFKIIMPSNNSPFKESVDTYFL